MPGLIPRLLCRVQPLTPLPPEPHASPCLTTQLRPCGHPPSPPRRVVRACPSCGATSPLPLAVGLGPSQRRPLRAQPHIPAVGVPAGTACFPLLSPSLPAQGPPRHPRLTPSQRWHSPTALPAPRPCSWAPVFSSHLLPDREPSPPPSPSACHQMRVNHGSPCHSLLAPHLEVCVPRGTFPTPSLARAASQPLSCFSTPVTGVRPLPASRRAKSCCTTRSSWSTGSVARVVSVTAGPAWPRPPWGPPSNVVPRRGRWLSDLQPQLSRACRTLAV